MLKVTKISTGLVMFYILMYSQTWGDNHAILYGSSMIVVCSMAIYWLKEGCIDLSIVPYGIWNNFIMIIYSVLTGIFVAYNYSAMINSCITYASFSIICVAICYVSSKEHSFEWVFNYLIGIAIICVLYMLIRGTPWKGYGRTLSSNNNPHTFAAVMNLGIFSVAYKCKKHHIQEMIVSGLLILLFLYGIVECGSRKYLLASVFLVAIWGVTNSSKIWKKQNTNQRILLSLIICIILVAVVYYYIAVYSSTLSYSRMLDAEDDGNINRVKYYKMAINIFKERPLFGGGFDQFRHWSGVGAYSHSTYAESIADYGFIGSILYFLPIILTSIVTTKAAVKTRDYKSVLLFVFCFAELFLGIGQIFFMEFYHFVAWTILFFLGNQIVNASNAQSQRKETKSKYIKA